MKKETLTILITEFLLTAFFAAGISGYMGPVLGICIALIMYLLFFFLWKKGVLPVPEMKRYKSAGIAHVTEIVDAILVSGSLAVIQTFFLSNLMANTRSLNIAVLGISAFLFLFLPVLSVGIGREKKTAIKSKEQIRENFFLSTFSVLVPALILFLFLPGELFFNNAQEMTFAFADLVRAMGILFAFAFALIYLISFLPETVKKIILSLFNAFTIGGYVQYLFFNRYVKELSGGAYLPDEHMLFTVVNALVWIAIIAASIIISVKIKKFRKAPFYVSCIIFVLLFTSFLFLLIKTPSKDLKRKQFYLSAEEQFTVGKEENVIVFVLDGVDNSFIEGILAENPEVFDLYNDFTLYTDTCSVYDFSCPSILQFLYGYTYAEGTDRSLPFQERFKEAGYRFIPFNEYAVRNPENIDNYLPADSSTVRVKFKEIRKNMLVLSCYRLFPCAVKGMLHSEKVNFATCLEYTKTGEEIIADNHQFEENLHLEYNSASGKCFIYQHIEGAHYPCDYVEETKYCLAIFAEYMRQLKELGVYDNTAIILAADHGVHDDTADVPFPTAATPLFMVKRIQESHDQMIIDDTPMYYVDFQPTILSAAGLFNPDTDYEIFGKPVEDYKGVERRERSWFDTGFGNQKTRKYTYTGDASELERVVKEGIYEETDSYEFIYREE